MIAAQIAATWRLLTAGLVVACLLALGAQAAGRVSDPAAVRQEVARAAVSAQTSCYRLIHHDTFAFEQCLRGLLKAETKPTPRRLGIEYFGFVGAMNSARLGMLGARQTAWEFLQRYRQTQRRLRLDDAALCATIAGDCEVRIAQARQLEVAGRPAPVDATDRGAEPGHAH